MPQYFLDLPEEAAPVGWDPAVGAEPRRHDTRYWSGVFREMERTLHDPDLKVYLSWDPDHPPARGPRVVIVLLGDEGSRLPRYLDEVGCVFKCYGTHPVLGAGPLRDRSLTGVAALAQAGVRWLRWLPGGIVHAQRRARTTLRREPEPTQVPVVPLGTFNQLDLPLVPIEEREHDVFFAGSVEHKSGWAQRHLSPKTRARREMLSALTGIAAVRPGLRVDLRLTSSFGGSESASSSAYSAAMMDSRICLAPRGNSVETFRLLEGLRCGCLVVCDRLPPHPFYRGGPFLQLGRWNELEATLAPYLDDLALLAERHRQALAWWRGRCSEAAIGRFIAERLNRLGRLAPRGSAPSG